MANNDFIIDEINYTKDDISNALKNLSSKQNKKYRSENTGIEYSILYKENRYAIELIYEQMRYDKKLEYDNNIVSAQIKDVFLRYYEILPEITKEAKKDLKKKFKEYLIEKNQEKPENKQIKINSIDTDVNNAFFLANTKKQIGAKKYCAENEIYFWKIFENEKSLKKYHSTLKYIKKNGIPCDDYGYIRGTKKLQNFFNQEYGGYINWIKQLGESNKQEQKYNDTKLLEKLYSEYIDFKNSEDYSEQYKWDYAQSHEGEFNSLNNLEEKIKNLGNDNFKPYFLQRSGLTNLMKPYNIETFKSSLSVLFDETKRLDDRIENFLQILKNLLLNDENWRKKDMLPDVADASYFLFTNNYKKYLLFNPKRAFNNFAKLLNLPEWLDNTNSVKRYIKIMEYAENKLIPFMNSISDSNHTLLDVQDFIRFIDKQEDKDMAEKISLNQILYGPPGTGKTYNTVIKAMSIIDNKEYTNVSDEEYSELKVRFDKLKQEEQIEFVTFHQSYAYEEFVEGIKPYIPEWNSSNDNKISYVGKNGIFKNICKNAEKELYKISNIEDIDFDKVYKMFQEKYESGSSFSNLINIRYEPKFLVYHFGQQQDDRRIDLDKIKALFAINKKYKNATEFNKDYKGISSLKGYYFNFYKELIKIKEDLNEENQNKTNINKNYKKYILIIDEINRGNISKIFGELITLIEEDKRLGNKYQLETTLPYSNESFGVPKNLYILGTMNTSDRSIASIDIALRRRFKFIEMMPDKDLVADFGIGFVDIFEKLNTKIKILLDRDHQIGHSYFIKTKYENARVDELKTIWFTEILPLLNEYFYGDWEKLKLIIPAFIKEVVVPPALKNDCEEHIYGFKLPNEIENFESALKQEDFKSNLEKEEV